MTNAVLLKNVVEQIRPAAVLFVLLTVITGIVYPLIVRGIAAVAFPGQAAGSLLSKDGKPIGSRLIGQAFDGPKYFCGRPSATVPYGYNAGASSGSNLGPLNEALERSARERVERLKTAYPDQRDSPPVDLVTASGSGLDPHISPAAAYYQCGRVAHARGLPEEQIRGLVAQHVETRTLGVLGEPRVNVLLLNLALDGLH
jgi:K+-transporting ATPase ATPase C chain